ncbi:substrate-binding domain-containing protein [Pseudobutyrivibrio sp.]|jgi:putative multiple sugar transport system substrate-binding protein|uniref:substrate-binding domain-containing protein n=1 Tax=Pseudobutyrivibrio sp. TaxID=2014367 RepID=UPI001D744281|nr:sugar-binding protein [Pseudobutyrivibrio sp.]MBE5912127.1 sugar ABC transporter substrate-binding protein [Pseudobutyrivibrio sp.]
MKKKLLSLLLTGAMAASMFVGCGTSTETTDGGASGGDAAQTTESSDAAASTGKKVGVSMPTKDLQRWNQDGANMQEKLEAAGYEVELQYASNQTDTQVNQIETMINDGCDVLVIAAIESSSLGTVMDKAKENNIPVIAYDRLIMNSDAVSYYATFDNFQVGVVQGQYIVDTLGLDVNDTSKTYTMEITAGDPGDNNAGFFYNGAMSILQDYIDAGIIEVKSGQVDFEDVATASWATEKAQSRMDSILSNYYSDGTNLDICLCSNDSTALGVENSLAANYTGDYPIVTGQDCDIENTKNMIAGKQSMSVFKDTRKLAEQVVTMVGQILNNEKVDVNDEETYDNGTGIIPSYLCTPEFADANNYKELLIDSGYYTEDQLQ